MIKTLNNSFNQNSSGETNGKQPQQGIASVPQQMTLPKGGGAIRGIGEKFSTNPLTGTATISIPIFTTPSRWDFYPKLSLTYDSGSGNGVFGLGWDISFPSISRKTEKELPRYWDEENFDTFILSGAEDLVPSLDKNNDWKEIITEDASGDYIIQRFRPRIEGLFARIEKWKNKTKKEDVFWRTISKDNVTTIYGKNTEYRIADPEDGSHIFKWLIEKSFDDKGNVIFYQYKQENQENIDKSLPQEKNRLLNDYGFGNRYLKRIKYCNKEPYNNTKKPEPENYECLLEVIFDYGEHDVKNRVVQETKKWLCRLDAFSAYRAGFEIRTYRLCRRVLMIHHFKELGDSSCLVRSTEFEYQEDPIASFLKSVKQTGYIRESEDNYREKSIPPIEFTYTKQKIDDEIHTIDQESIENLPIGLDGRQYRWLDLNSGGLPGILTEQAGGGWFYKQNLGNGTFGPIQSVAPKPSLSNLQDGRQEIMDLADDGEKYLVQFSKPLEGFYRLNTQDNQWDQFTPFASTPGINWNNPNLRFIDLNGDGFADILISENDTFVMYLSKSTEGFSSSQVIHKLRNEEKGPELVFADLTESVYLADISGDGQTDIVRIRNGEVCYWPNLGYGHFGAKVTMGNAPIYDHPDYFEQSRIRLADTDGSGVADIIYLGRDGIKFWLNQSGNSWSDVYKLSQFPRIDNLSSVMVLDLLGNGMSCVVWSSSLPVDAGHHFQYIDLMGGEQPLTKLKQKPHLLESMKNNMGAETRIQYCSSTRFYLEDLAGGTPWITKLPFPVHLVERFETFDYLTRTKLVSLAKYHHGYYDRDDREFRGFGLVEQWDTESFEQFKDTGLFAELEIENLQEEALHVPPVYTKTWFHTGFHTEGDIISKHFEKEYFSEMNEKWKGILKGDILLEDTLLPVNLTFKEENEACRALKGQILRQEIYSLDNSDKSEYPYTVSERNYGLRMIQPILPGNRNAVFYQFEHEILDIYYERNPIDPRIQHKFVLEVDDYGNVKRKVVVYYPRSNNNEDGNVYEEQLLPKAILDLTEYTDIINMNDSRQNPIAWQARSCEMDGRKLFSDNEIRKSIKFSKIENIVNQIIDNNDIIEFKDEFDNDDNRMQARNIRWERKYFLDENGKILDLKNIAIPLRLHKTETAVFPTSYMERIYKDKTTDSILHEEGGYIKSSGYWWNPGIVQQYLDKVFFFLPSITCLPDPLGSLDKREYSEVHYDEKYKLVPIRFTDPLKNKTMVAIEKIEQDNIFYQIDYRLLLPKEIIDMNNNHSQVIYDELGIVTAATIFGTENNESIGDEDILVASFQVFQYANLSDILSNPQKFIQNATSFFYYDHFAWVKDGLPPFAISIHRERHLHESEIVLQPDQEQRFQFMILYSDGLGKELQKKLKDVEGIAWVQQEDGSYKERNVLERWLTNGKTVYNNKSEPVKQYEPFYSDSSKYEKEESLIKFGVTPLTRYDPLERVIRTDLPKGFHSNSVFNAWKQEHYDENDNVKQSRFYDELVNQSKPLESLLEEKGWTEERLKVEKEVLKNTEEHTNTPKTIYLNNLGQQFLESNWVGGEQIFTHSELDINGNMMSIIDPRQFIKNKERIGFDEVKSFAYDYDMQDRQITSQSMDSGIIRVLPNALNNPIYVWNARESMIHTIYDKLQRPTQVHVKGGDSDLDNIVEEIHYGESVVGPDEPDRMNIRGKPIKHKDQAGVKEFILYDIKGHNVKLTTRLRNEYHHEVEWNPDRGEEILEVDENGLPRLHVSAVVYNALNWLVLKKLPDGSIHYYDYYQSGLLKSVAVKVNEFDNVSKNYVKDIQYNAKGQRISIIYGNGTKTNYTYEKDTFRLESLRTHRLMDDSNKLVQDMIYVYDPVGNIALLTDYSHRAVFNDGEMIKPKFTCAYDSLYRLTHTSGRQHSVILPDDYRNPDAFKQSRYLSFGALINNSNLLENYEEHYEYDLAGNLEKVIHSVQNNPSRSWTKVQTFAEDSNRIMFSQIGDQEQNGYFYDSAGNMLRLDHLKEIHYNYRNNIASAVLVMRPEGLNDSEYYIYDSTGTRVRKVTERYVKINNGFKFLDIDEKIYLDGIEIKRNKRINIENNSSEISLERFSSHIIDDKKRVAIIHRWTIDVNARETDDIALLKVHYQFGNHLGSCSLEINDDEQIISYEEYYPYGGTAFIAGKSLVSSLAKEISIREYRYVGKERDDNTSMYYYGMRYYVPWLARWTSCDPTGITDGLNAYLYAQDNPLNFGDSSGTQAKPKLNDGGEGASAEGYGEDVGGTPVDEPNSSEMPPEPEDQNYTPSDVGPIFIGSAWVNGESALIISATAEDRIRRNNTIIDKQREEYEKQVNSDLALNSHLGVKLQRMWNEGSAADKVEMAATGVGVASVAVPVAGDFIALGASTTAFIAKPSWSNFWDIPLDAVGAALPIVPALGTVGKAEHLANAGHDLNRLRKDSPDFYAYQLVDEAGDSVYYGKTNDPVGRLRDHAAKPPGPFSGMQVISGPHPEAQVLNLEQSLIQQADKEGRFLYNIEKKPFNWKGPRPDVLDIPPTIAPAQTLLNPMIYRW